MKLFEDHSLRHKNTFRIDVLAKYYGEFRSCYELEEILHLDIARAYPTLIIGGGSNVLFIKDVNALVLKNSIAGIEEVGSDEQFVYLKAGAGESWHQFVLYCIGKGLGGSENLSLIPGSIGATPIQNIGAYGVELKDIFYELEAFHLHEKKVWKFGLNECEFGYRDSVFKSKYRGQFVILSVTYRLRKEPKLNTAYGALEKELREMGVSEPGIRDVSKAVINIRTAKLPDPDEIGNAGSFFKNPEVAPKKYDALRKLFPGIVGYPLENGFVKVAAGWLIEQCGWKGYRKGDAGCHEKQSLVLVNYGTATGREIFQLSEEIMRSVKSTFDIELEREVNVVNY